MADQADGLFSPWLRRKRLERARPYVRGNVLDFGCGIGVLARYCEPTDYLGVDIDEESLGIARARNPRHRFSSEIDPAVQYDSIVALAVIEHTDARALLERFERVLHPAGRVVLTTPHPAFEWAHELGARVGLFSREASDDHEELLTRRSLAAAARSAGLRLQTYERFLFGANQLFVLRKR